MNIKLKVTMQSGEIYKYYFVDNLHDATIFADDIDQFLINHSCIINDSIESIMFIISDGITEICLPW